MEPSFEEAFDFDLNFIQQPVQNVMSTNKLRKAILIAKKKTIATDSLIKKYLAKKETVRQSELMLNSAKEECRRVCIDYRDTLEKCTSLEKELQILDQKYKTLESNYMLSQNQCEAIKSHANQLQSLIKENELKIESLQIENKLLDKKKEKESKGHEGTDKLLHKENEFKNDRKENYNKGYSSIRKENRTLYNHILLFKDIIMGKTKLEKEHKLILNRYKKQKEEKEISNKELYDYNYSGDETDFFDDVTPPPSNETLLSPFQNLNSKTVQLKVFKENIDDHCASTVPNGIHDSELDSEDTGRGSSLAFSDSGKFINSPDHYFDDTPNMEANQRKIITTKCLDASTNTSCDMQHKATSPLLFDDVALLSDNIGMQGRKSAPSPEYFISDIPLSTEVVTIREKIKVVDCASSPIPELDIMNASLDLSKSNCKITIEDLMMDVSLSLSPDNILKSIDCATSPIQGINRVHVCLSPIDFNNGHVLNVNDTKVSEKSSDLNPVQVDIESPSLFSTVLENINLPQISSQDSLANSIVEISKNNTLEKNCLEANSSNNISSKNSDDKEIEMIFSSMRLEHRLLTPIPRTPLKLRKSLNRQELTVTQENCSNHKCCKNIIILEKKYLMLQKNYAAMEKVIKGLKSSLQALTILPLQSINDGCMNEESTDVYSGNESDKDEEKIDLHTQSNHECNSQFDSMAYTNINKKKSQKQRIQEVIEEVAKINDDENMPLSEFVIDSGINPKDSRSVTYEENSPTKNLNRIVSHGGSVSPDNINRFRIASPAKNLSPIRSIVNNSSNTEDRDGDHHKIKSYKNKKLSKLEKLRHKMLPKYKISENSKSVKLRKKKSVVMTSKKAETDKLLQNKLAFENAVKIMAEAKVNNTMRKSEKIMQLGSENAIETYNKSSKGNLISDASIEESVFENVLLGQIKTVQKYPDDNATTRSSGRTTRSQSEKSNKQSIDNNNVNNFDNEVNKSMSNIQELINANEPYKENQKPQNIGLKSDKLCHFVSNRRTTRSQSKLSESESDLSLRQKNLINIAIYDNSCKRSIEDQNIDDKDKVEEESKKKSLSKDVSEALSLIEPSDSMSQETIDYITNKTDVTCNFLYRSPGSRKRLRASCDEVMEPPTKRVLRSSKVKESIIESMNTSSSENNCIIDSDRLTENECNASSEVEITQHKKQEVIDYGDLNIFTTTKTNCNEKKNVTSTFIYPKNSILCKSINKYGKKSLQFSTNKVSEQVANSICTKLEEDIANITQMPADKINQGMTKLVEDLQKIPVKTFLTGLMKYLKQPMRKQEMFKLVITPPAPPMTKSEQILLFVIKQLKQNCCNIVERILENMEYSLFQLNKTPEFDIVESMSHLYAIICRYFGLKHRLRLFLLDAMYCMSFKAVSVVKNCLDVWMHILPLAHMGIAKSPLVTCLVYLLHFYKCDDKFKKIDAIRNTLQYKYFYKITEMTEVKMLEMFTNAVKQINDVLIEKKILRTALIILAKRQGAVWCQKNIIKNILLPIIEQEKCSDVSKQFAVSMLGPLVKPYPVDMKVHSEIIVNQLMDMLDQNPSDKMKEAIFMSLIFMSRQNHFKVTQALLNWEPESVSQEFEGVIKDFVTEKPIKTWTKILPKMLFQQE